MTVRLVVIGQRGLRVHRLEGEPTLAGWARLSHAMNRRLGLGWIVLRAVIL